MKLTVKLFAFLSEELGSEVIVDLPARTTITDIKAALANDDQQIKAILADSRVAVNQEFVNNEQLTLTPSDEIAIIPPVSGG